MSTLTGGGPNLVTHAVMAKVYSSRGLTSPLSVRTWLVIALPVSILCTLFMAVVLTASFLQNGGEDSELQRLNQQKMENIIETQFKALGPACFSEIYVACSLLVLVVLWLTLDRTYGWTFWLPEGFIGDSTPAVFMGMLMFAVPYHMPGICADGCRTGKESTWPILSMKSLEHRGPWTLLPMLGASFALTEAVIVSGLSRWLGDFLNSFTFFYLNWPSTVLYCMLSLAVLEVNCANGTAMAATILPLLSEMAIQINMNPILLLFPSALVTSMTFVFPDLLDFGQSISQWTLITHGLVAKFMCLFLVFVVFVTLGDAIFGLTEFPVELRSTPNTTATL